MNVEGTVAFIAGTVLMYSALRRYKPIDVVKWALGGPRPVAPPTGTLGAQVIPGKGQLDPNYQGIPNSGVGASGGFSAPFIPPR
jgi:hypothetical protein